MSFAGYAYALFTVSSSAARFGFFDAIVTVHAFVAVTMIGKTFTAFAYAAFAFFALAVCIACISFIIVRACTFGDDGWAFAREWCFSIDTVDACTIFTNTGACDVFLDIATDALQRFLAIL